MTTVLIIDDNAELRDTLVTILEDEGYVTIVADDGKSGVRAFSKNHPDLVITDVLMPDHDGIQTICDIRRLQADARIIAMSGGALLDNTYYLRMAQELGAMAILPKPFEVEDLVQLVATCIDAPTADPLSTSAP